MLLIFPIVLICLTIYHPMHAYRLAHGGADLKCCLQWSQTNVVFTGLQEFLDIREISVHGFFEILLCVVYVDFSQNVQFTWQIRQFFQKLPSKVQHHFTLELADKLQYLSMKSKERTPCPIFESRSTLSSYDKLLILK